jgi:Amt family ammonium transporter
VHISSGVSALICALVLGVRRGYGKVAMPPHSVVLSVIGAALLWVGWFGFNAGSALSAGHLAGAALINTHLAGATAAMAWLFLEWFKTGKPTVLGAISGAVAGLAMITPASGFTTPMYAMVIGCCGGIFCFFGATMVKQMLGYDDSLDAFGVHGVAGISGTILTGVFAVGRINSDKAGLVDGHSIQVAYQAGGSLITVVLSVVATFILLKLTDALCGLRVSEEHEFDGLDLSQHGESGYNLEEDLFSASYEAPVPAAHESLAKETAKA